MIHRILQRTFYDELGKIQADYYIIQVKKYFLGIPFWKNIKECHCDYTGCYSTNMKFATFDKALDYIENYLCKKVKPKQIKRVVTEVNCIR